MRSIVVGLVLIVLLIGGAWFALSSTLTWVTHLNPNVAGSIIAATAALAGILYAQWHSRAREIAEGHRAEKIRVYTLFFDIVEAFMQGQRESSAEGDEGEMTSEMLARFAQLNRGLIIWSSPKVLRVWLAFRAGATAGAGPGLLLLVDDVLQAIRKDLGNSNFGLSRGDVVRVYLSNPDELEQVRRG